ncbi:MAG: GNAT family N-acetyltransferase [Opitutaceae bacterium]
MTSPTPPCHVVHNVERQRFETEVEGQLAFASYVREGPRVVFDHTYVPDALRGRGMAATVTRAALDEARRQRWTIVPRCSFVAGFIERNAEFAALVDRTEPSTEP